MPPKRMAAYYCIRARSKSNPERVRVYFVTKRRLDTWCKEHYWGDKNDPEMAMRAVFDVQYHPEKLKHLASYLKEKAVLDALPEGGRLLDTFGGITWFT